MLPNCHKTESQPEPRPKPSRNLQQLIFWFIKFSLSTFSSPFSLWALCVTPSWCAVLLPTGDSLTCICAKGCQAHSICVCVRVSQTTWLQKEKKRKKLNPNLATSKQLCCCIFIYFYLRVVLLYFPWPLEQKESLQKVGIWTVHGKKLALGHVLDVPRN